MVAFAQQSEELARAQLKIDSLTDRLAEIEFGSNQGSLALQEVRQLQSQQQGLVVAVERHTQEVRKAQMGFKTSIDQFSDESSIDMRFELAGRLRSQRLSKDREDANRQAIPIW